MARQQAEVAARQALDTAGQIILSVISTEPENTAFWVDFMLPLHPDDLRAPLFDHKVGKANTATASHLWRDCRDSKTRLVVVAETLEEPEHLGFWLPLYPNYRSGSPGATNAYYAGYGSAVFVNDLPVLERDLEGASQQEWENYIGNKLQRQVNFVSIPFFLKRKGVRKTLAVLNVHFSTQDPDTCRRAYEGEWLKLAQRQAAPLICEAYKAIVIQYGKPDKEGMLPSIGTDPRRFPWNRNAQPVERFTDV